MATKRLTLVMYESDRTLWDGAALTCRVIDLFASGGPRELLRRRVPATVELELDLAFDGGHAYGISIDAAGHGSAWHVVTRRTFVRDDNGAVQETDHAILRLMLVHRRAAPSDLDAAFHELELAGSPFARFGVERFAGLRQPSARLAFFNLEAKLRAIRLDGRSLLSFVRDVREADVDRVFLLMAAEARSLVDQAADFEEAPGHGVPTRFPSLPEHPHSWKETRFNYGNLQLSFSRATVLHGAAGQVPEACYSVDADIDLERDLGHAFEYVYNLVFKKTTDQTLVYRLLWDQNILPAYHLLPPADARGRASVVVSTTFAPAPPATALRSTAAAPRAARAARAPKTGRAQTGRARTGRRTAAPAKPPATGRATKTRRRGGRP